MKDKCKCKNPDKYQIIDGVGIRCEKCLRWIFKVRKVFRLTKIKEPNRFYKRNKEKEKFKKRLEEEE